MTTSNENLLLYQDQDVIQYSGGLPFAATKTFVHNTEKLGMDPMAVLREIAGKNVFYILEKENVLSKNEHFFEILCRDVVILVKGDYANGDLLILAAYKKDNRKQNKMIKYGVKIQTQGTNIAVHGQHLRVPNNMTENQMAHIRKRFTNAHQELRLEMKVRSVNDNDAGEDTEIDGKNEISHQTTDLLDLALNYVMAEDEDERLKAQQIPKVMYTSFEAASDYRRIDKAAYAFEMVQEFDETTQPGIPVTLELKDQTEANAFLTDIIRMDVGTKYVLLFNDEIDANHIPEQGTIGMGYNDVQKVVREEVLESLRESKSKAVNFDNTVGQNCFAGFENKDLSDLESTLLSSDRPPNASQIEAIKKGINVKDMLLVLGPPGTGKTTVILEWVKHFVLKEKNGCLYRLKTTKQWTMYLNAFWKRKRST